jgi:hypothetical protein
MSGGVARTLGSTGAIWIHVAEFSLQKQGQGVLLQYLPKDHNGKAISAKDLEEAGNLREDNHGHCDWRMRAQRSQLQLPTVSPRIGSTWNFLRIEMVFESSIVNEVDTSSYAEAFEVLSLSHEAWITDTSFTSIFSRFPLDFDNHAMETKSNMHNRTAIMMFSPPSFRRTCKNAFRSSIGNKIKIVADEWFKPTRIIF